MVSSTHKEDQVVVSKEITNVSSPKNKYDSNKYDIPESSSSRTSALSKDVGDNVKNKGVLAEHHSSVSVEAIAPEAEGEVYVIVCDTCGELGWTKLLAICKTCKVGAEHTYCMKVKLKKVPKEWFCYDCRPRNKDGVCEGGDNDEAVSRKRKAESLTDVFEKAETSQRTSSQGRPRLFKTKRLYDTVDLGLNMDPNLDLNRNPNLDDPNLVLNRDPNLDLNVECGFDLNRVPNLDLNMESVLDLNRNHNLDLHMEPGLDLNRNLNLDHNRDSSIDLNVDPTLDLNVDPNIDKNPDLSLDYASFYRLGSSSNFQAR